MEITQAKKTTQGWHRSFDYGRQGVTGILRGLEAVADPKDPAKEITFVVADHPNYGDEAYGVFTVEIEDRPHTNQQSSGKRWRYSDGGPWSTLGHDMCLCGAAAALALKAGMIIGKDTTRMVFRQP